MASFKQLWDYSSGWVKISSTLVKKLIVYRIVKQKWKRKKKSYIGLNELVRYNYDFLKIISNLEESMRVNIYVPGLGNDLLNMTPKAQTIKQWNDGLS